MIVIHCLCFFFVSVWSVGNTAYCLRDPHQGAPPSSGLQYPSVPQGWNSASLPAHLPGLTGGTLSWSCFNNTFHLFRRCYLPLCVCLKEHRDEHLTAIPQEVCLSFVKIIQEVLGSPPDMDLLKLIYNFLLAVHPPTNTYVCHTPASFYFSLHIGEEAARLKAAALYKRAFNWMQFFWCWYLSDGKLYQEKVQSIMYLRHSSSGGKSTSSSVVSLSPTVFTDALHEGTAA